MNKLCKSCGIIKDALEFYKNPHHKDELSTRCKLCASDYSKVYRLRPGVKQMQAQCASKWRKTPRGKEYTEAYRKTDKRKDSSLRYDNSDKGKSKKTEYSKSEVGKESHKKASAKYARSERGKSLHLEYIKTPKGRQINNVIQNRRRARVNALEFSLTVPEWNETVVSYGNRCVYCNKKLDAPEQDHIVPISIGGNHTKDNIIPACRSCNASKGNKPLIFWMAQKVGFAHV